MIRHLLMVTMLFAAALQVAAQSPLYIVNGTPREEIASIPPEDIENVEMLPADEETIANYGSGAAHGVMLITLRHDTEAILPGEEGNEESLTNYIIREVAWDDEEPAARVVVRYTILSNGELKVDKVLESTDSRLRRRVLKALTDAPVWTPATKAGTPVDSNGVVNIQLPLGKKIPHQVELIIR